MLLSQESRKLPGSGWGGMGKDMSPSGDPQGTDTHQKTPAHAHTHTPENCTHAQTHTRKLHTRAHTPWKTPAHAHRSARPNPRRQHVAGSEPGHGPLSASEGWMKGRGGRPAEGWLTQPPDQISEIHGMKTHTVEEQKTIYVK